MCAVCGCGQPDRPEGEHEHEHEHVGPDGKVYRHTHPHEHEHEHEHHHDHDHEEPEGLRTVRVERAILEKNDAIARQNRARFQAAGTFVVNLMSSPGSGKTTLLVRTLRELAGRFRPAVIEGDQQTSLDADRIRATGAPAVQINTGKGCHLDAAMVGRALADLSPPPGVLFIENVGNLVCPAGFDLGEHRRAVVVSVTEGEDKPLKYPDMFAAADVVLINKADLLPYLAFDAAALEANVRRVKLGARVLRVSATTGEGMGAWLAWLSNEIASAKGTARP